MRIAGSAYALVLAAALGTAGLGGTATTPAAAAGPEAVEFAAGDIKLKATAKPTATTTLTTPLPMPSAPPAKSETPPTPTPGE